MTAILMHRLVLPGIFWHDHHGRRGDRKGERTVIKDGGETRTRVTVELDDIALGDLLSDADYYGYPGAAWDEAYLRVIGRSARSTIDAVHRQVSVAKMKAAAQRFRMEG